MNIEWVKWGNQLPTPFVAVCLILVIIFLVDLAWLWIRRTVNPKSKTMKSVCAWCKRVIREGDGEVTHGQCPECLEKMKKEIEEYYKREEAVNVDVLDYMRSRGLVTGGAPVPGAVDNKQGKEIIHASES